MAYHEANGPRRVGTESGRQVALSDTLEQTLLLLRLTVEHKKFGLVQFVPEQVGHEIL